MPPRRGSDPVSVAELAQLVLPPALFAGAIAVAVTVMGIRCSRGFLWKENHKNQSEGVISR